MQQPNPQNEIHQRNSESYQRIMEGNHKFIESKLQSDPEYFKKLSTGQHPKILLIGCSDSRVPPNELTGLDPGEMFIHRNIGNQILLSDLSLNCVIQYAVEVLKVHHIVIFGHTGCGGVKAALSHESHGGFLDCWIGTIKNTYDKNIELMKDLDEDSKVDLLVRLNVKEGMKNIWKNPIVQKAWNDNEPVWVHGWVVKLEDGLIEEISLDEAMPNSLELFKFEFHKQQINVHPPDNKHHHHKHHHKQE